jgi:hypothetical protein
MLQSARKGVNYRHPLRSQYDQDTGLEREAIAAKANNAVGFATPSM